MKQARLALRSKRFGSILSLFLLLFSVSASVFFLQPATHAFRPVAPGGNVQSPKGVQIGFLLGASSANKKALGLCPLKHTDVKADVAGFVSYVTVKQQFHNPYDEKIEAIYTFPLPENAAVNSMTMKVGNRVIRGSIKERQEARDIYEAAYSRGSLASLLDQERPNVFTQSVANIEPGETIEVEIKYVNVLKYDSGKFSFMFPTVVDSRFIPGTAAAGGSRLVGLGEPVGDGALLNPPVAADGKRAGHDITIALNINSPIAIGDVSCDLHQIDIKRESTNRLHLNLKPQDRIPNRDFVVNWEVASDQVRSGFLSHGNRDGGFFSLLMVPPKRVQVEQVAPKEMIFLIDCSGSQSGLPMQKAKETLHYILGHMNPKDTFQVIAFNQGEAFSSAKPELASAAMKARAIRFIDSLKAQGGTWMAPAVEKVCSLPNPDKRLRIVTFMTDGKVGNDMQVIDMIKHFRGSSRWFAFGTGDSVNRFLIDKIAAEGGGEAEYVLLTSSAEDVGKKFYSRISSPILTDIKVEFSGVQVKEVFPKELTDLWAQKPLFITGRYLKPGKGKAILTGLAAGKPYRQELSLTFSEKQPDNSVLKSIWARAKVDRLMSEDWCSMQLGVPDPELKQEIIDTALKYHIMSQYTSFVAVEDHAATADGVPRLDAPASRTIYVPVESVKPAQRLRANTSTRANEISSSFQSQDAAPFESGISDRALAPRYQASNTKMIYSPMQKQTAFMRPGETSIASASYSKASTGHMQKTSPASASGLLERLTSGSRSASSSLRGAIIKQGSQVSSMKQVTVRVSLKALPDEKLLEKLRKIGLVIKTNNGLLLIGSINSDRIGELSRLDGVRKVEAF